MKRTGKNSLIRIMALMMAFFFAITLHTTVSHAAVAIFDTSKTGGLTITHISVDDELIPGVTSHLYLVATVDEYGKYTITDEFKGCFSDPDFFNNNFEYDDWKSCVEYDEASDSDKLKDYITTNGISEVASLTSDDAGKTYYTGLTLGIYYVLSDKAVQEEYTHSFVNFVYPVPLMEKDSETAQLSINYNPSVSPKKSKVKNDVMVHCSIRKRWNDSGNTSHRPESVTFNIYCDGEFKETVVLSSENDWNYVWSQAGLHDYTVEEVAPGSGYTSSMNIIQNGHDFEYICTNTYNPPPTPPDTPDTPDEPGIPDIPEVLGAIRDLPEVLGARRLPQTGQLWWPLPILVIAGVFMIVKGIKKNSKNA